MFFVCTVHCTNACNQLAMERIDQCFICDAICDALANTGLVKILIGEICCLLWDRHQLHPTEWYIFRLKCKMPSAFISRKWHSIRFRCRCAENGNQLSKLLYLSENRAVDTQPIDLHVGIISTFKYREHDVNRIFRETFTTLYSFALNSALTLTIA